MWTDKIISEDAPKLIVFGSNSEELTRQSREFSGLGYEVFPFVVTDDHIKRKYCDKKGKIVKSRINDSATSGPYAALVGEYMVSSEDDVVRAITKVKPDAILAKNHYKEEWAEEGLVGAVKTIAARTPMVIDIGVNNNQISAEYHKQAANQGLILASGREYELMDDIFRASRSR